MARTPIRLIPCGAVILGLCSPAAAQQTPPADAPAATEPAPGTPPGKQPAVKPSEAPIPDAEQSLVGFDVFSSEGTRVGEVRAVSTDTSGDVVALHIRTGGFLGFGGRTVAVPKGHFTRTGRTVRLDLGSDQVSTLPEVKE